MFRCPLCSLSCAICSRQRQPDMAAQAPLYPSTFEHQRQGLAEDAACHGPCAVDSDYPPWLGEGHPLAALETALRDGCPCQLCGAFARMPLVTPCTHLLCVDCAWPQRQDVQQPQDHDSCIF
jgi:hypothetical protein